MSRAILIFATLGVVVAAFVISTHNYNASQARGDTSSTVVPASIPDGSSRSNDAEMQAYCNGHPLRGTYLGVCRGDGHPVPVGQ